MIPNNPNLLSGRKILADVGSDPVFPKTQNYKSGGSITDSIRLPFRSIFDQPEEKRNLFTEPTKLKENTQLITARELAYLANGGLEEEKANIITASNEALKNNNYMLAEELLGRPLTQGDIMRNRVSDERVYNAPNPEYKNFEDLTLSFNTKDALEEKKLNMVVKNLKDQSIPYELQNVGGYNIKLKSYKRVKNVIFPRAIETDSRNQEDLIKEEKTLPYNLKPEFEKQLSIPELELPLERTLPLKPTILQKLGVETISDVIRARQPQTYRFAEILNIPLDIDNEGKLITKSADIKNTIKKMVENEKLEKQVVKIEGFGMLEKKSTKKDMVEFGKYKLDIEKLNTRIVKFLTKKGLRVYRLPPMYVSSRFAIFLKDLIETRQPNSSMFNSLNRDEKDLFQTIRKITQVSLEENDTNPSCFYQNEDLQERLQVLIGSLGSGNDSPQVKNEISQVLNALRVRKLIHPKQVAEISHKVFGNI